MKSNGLIISLIIILGIIAVLLTILLVFLLSGNQTVFSFGNFNEIQEEIYNNVYESEYSSININTDAANIYVKENNEDNTKVIVYGKKNLFTINDLSSLDINLRGEKCIGFCFNRKVARIEVYLPKDYDGKITIDNKYGDVFVDEFMGADLKVKSSYGDTEIRGANIINIKSSAGDINIDEVNRISAENNYGDIVIGKINEYLDIHADCGDIKISEINLIEDSQIKNNLGDIKITKSTGARIDAKTSLGDTKVNDNDFKSDITLTIDNSCGDIKVN